MAAAVTARSADTASFLDALRRSAARSSRLPYDAVRAAYARACPGSADLPGFHQQVIAALRMLEQDGALRLPSSRSLWTTLGTATVPGWVQVIKEKPAPAPRDLTHAWHPRLAFAARETNADLLAALKIVDAFLKADGSARPLVPLRERSLELFGEEKFLDEAGKALFAAGRLTPADLRARHVPMPLPSRAPSIGHADDAPVLLVENLHAWDSLCAWNDQAGRYALVVYGSGNAVGQRVLEHLDLVAEGRPLRYLGDLDMRGIQIPFGLNQRRAARGLRPVEAETSFYRWLVSHGRRTSTKTGAESVDREAIRGFLPDDLHLPVESLLSQGRRIPQEALGSEALLRDVAPGA